jgi:hypothetical protein
VRRSSIRCREAETKPTPAGSVSVTLSEVAVSGPAFEIVSV